MIEDFLRPPRGPGQVIADLVRVIGALSVVAAAIWWTPTDAGILAFALPALLLPRFLRARAGFDIAYGLAVLGAAWSNVLDLYRTIAHWDLVVHFACTGILAAMVYLAFLRLEIVPDARANHVRRRTPIVIVTLIALSASVLWEMVEWVGYEYITDEIYVTYTDTIGDLAAGGLGGLVAGLFVASVRLDRPAEVTA